MPIMRLPELTMQSNSKEDRRIIL